MPARLLAAVSVALLGTLTALTPTPAAAAGTAESLLVAADPRLAAEAGSSTLTVQTASSTRLALTSLDAVGAAGRLSLDQTGGITAGSQPIGVDTQTTLLVTGDAGTCQVVGTVVVHEYLPTGQGAPTAALDWSGTCAAGPGDLARPTTGTLRLASTVPTAALVVAPDQTWSAPVLGAPNDTRSLTVRAIGGAPLTLGAVAVRDAAGATRGHLLVPTGTTCVTGLVLAPGGRCTVRVAAAPRAMADTAGWVELGVQGAPGRWSIGLASTGVQANDRGQFWPRSTRIMDTRRGLGVRAGTVGSKATVTLPVTGRQGVPATGVSAVVLNLTVTEPTASGFVIAYPSGTPRPGVSSINFPAGWTGANLVTVPVVDGGVSFYNASGSVHLIADLVGFVSADPAVRVAGTRLTDGAGYRRLVPGRLLDTRVDGGALRHGDWYDVWVGLNPPAVPGSVRALAVTLTTTGATASGYLSVTTDAPQGTLPDTSALNFTAGATVPNMVVVRPRVETDAAGTWWGFSVTNAAAAGTTQVIVDILGYWWDPDADGAADGLRFRPVAPTRVVDTRLDLGLPTLGARVDRVVTAPAALAGVDTAGLVGNLTGIRATTGTWLTLWGQGVRPGISTLNLATGETRAVSAWTGLAPDRTFRLWNAAGGPEAVYDVTGVLETFPPSDAGLLGLPSLAGARAATRGTADPGAATLTAVPETPRVRPGSVGPHR